jgi:hypothetical protein
MAEKLHKMDSQSSFSLTRFAEYRPQTFSADFTLEIPTLGPYLLEEHFQPFNLVVWLEVTSLTIKNLSLISARLEEIISITLNTAKDIFRIFPPKQDSFSLTINLLYFNHLEKRIKSVNFLWNAEQIQKSLFRGFSWDLEKWFFSEFSKISIQEYYDGSKWDLKLALNFIKEHSKLINSESIKEVNLLMLSCWDTEESFETLLQELEPFELADVSWYYLFTIAPLNSMTSIITDLLEMKKTQLLVPSDEVEDLQTFWKNNIIKLFEPILEITINPTEIGKNFEISTNVPKFQDEKVLENKLLIYNLRSIRYPLRINFFFTLPVMNKNQIINNQDPVVLDSLILNLKTSVGTIFTSETLRRINTYKLSLIDLNYQPERELNTRMRRIAKLRKRLEELLQIQVEKSAQIKKMISEPSYLTEIGLEDSILETINEIKLTFEIIEYLEEQELLLAELPPITKMFKPPVNSDLLD